VAPANVARQTLLAAALTAKRGIARGVIGAVQSGIGGSAENRGVNAGSGQYQAKA